MPIRSSALLVEAARAMPFGELCRAVDNWRIAADRERALDDEDRAFERRHLDVVPTAAGLVRLAGELDPDTGQSLITALRAVNDAEPRSGAADRLDARTPAPRRADALDRCAEAGSHRSTGRTSVARYLTSS